VVFEICILQRERNFPAKIWSQFFPQSAI
jgi:hypothetical protein